MPPEKTMPVLPARRRWGLAAVLVALATTVKIYPLAIGLLLAAVYPRRFAWRLLLALAVAAVLPLRRGQRRFYEASLTNAAGW